VTKGGICEGGLTLWGRGKYIESKPRSGHARTKEGGERTHGSSSKRRDQASDEGLRREERSSKGKVGQTEKGGIREQTGGFKKLDCE